MKAAGIVLAAGASQRMGSPKALLRDIGGLPLAARQVHILCAGGCDPAAVVVGSQADEIRRVLPADIWLVENPRWAEGRATSLQAGVGAFPETDGWLFLPVDAAGVKAETIRAVLAAAQREPLTVWRPVHEGRKGNLLWVPRTAAAELLRLPPGARVDGWARTRARKLPVDDPAILRNLNTPEEWMAFVQSQRQSGLPDRTGP